jgi:hypothetical protein
MTCKIVIKPIHYKILALASIAIGVTLIGVGAGMGLSVAVVVGVCLFGGGACAYMFQGSD